jgi:hypothetical protein
MENNYKYKSLREFKLDYPSEYLYLKRNNLLGKLCEDMGWSFVVKTENRKPNGYWNNKERCLEEALKYKTKVEWKNGSGSSYVSAVKNGWLKECACHMIIKNNIPTSYWVKETCIEEAKKYSSRSEWGKKSSNSYKIALVNDWYDECTPHMFEKQKPKGYWTKERCLEEAKKYKTITEWKNGSASSYGLACYYKFIDECTAHMIKKRKPYRYWTKKLCAEDAKKYSSRNEWQKNSGGYKSAVRNGWLEECCEHMQKLNKLK